MVNIISDIATLINAGFTVNDIKEVIKASKDTEAPAQVQSPAPAKAESKADDKPDDEPDYKALYEQAQKDLKDLQGQNTQDDISPEPLKVDEIIKSVKSHIC